MELLLWAWLFTLPGLLLTSLGVPRRRAGYASLLGPPAILAVGLSALVGGGSATIQIANWLPFLPDGSFSLLADPLSALLLTIVGFVALLVYLYSLGYMAEDPSRRRFFVFLDLFLATMALLVLAGNSVVLLIGWTGVGISSFLLISFWRDRPGTLGAGLQALGANAIGDAALLLAAVSVPAGCGALVSLGSASCTSGFGGAEFVALLIFVAAMAKSAQGPLYFWLPNAMAGPTPISALIHAATMVAAGVYLLARTHGLLEVAPTVSLWVAIVGTLTALAASVGGVLQNNFKKVIAFSTIAQLGYMFAGVGVGAPFSGLFHLFTHAAFKALLFLAAGIVIHGASNRESLVGLRGLGRYFPYSRVGFLIGSMALIGLPVVTAGAFSKDTILDATLAAQPLIGYALIAGVFLTGLYIGRLYAIIYAAPATDDHAVHHDAHAERWMNWALIPLMAGSIAFGYAGPWLDNALAGVLGGHETLPPLISPVGLLAFGLGAIGFAGAWWFALRKPAPAGADTPPAYAPAGWIAAIEVVSNGASRGVARVQSGALASYALATLLGVALVLVVRVALG